MTTSNVGSIRPRRYVGDTCAAQAFKQSQIEIGVPLMRHRARKTHRRQAPRALRQLQWRLMWLIIWDMRRWHYDPHVDHSLFAITRLGELLSVPKFVQTHVPGVKS